MDKAALIDTIKPLVTEWMMNYMENSATGGAVPSPHALSGIHHSGNLADSQATQFLKLDGSRALTGNLAVNIGVTIDGVDLNVFHAAHFILAENSNAPANARTLTAPGPITITDSGPGLTLALNLATPGTLAATSTNSNATNHTHSIDSTIARSAITITGVNSLGGGGDLTINRTITLNTPGALSATSANSSSVVNHTHSIDSTIARSAITITGAGSLGGGGALTANRTITLNTPGTLTVSTSNSTATNHTHAIASSSNPGPAASILASNASGHLQLERLGIAATPAHPLQVRGTFRHEFDATHHALLWMSSGGNYIIEPTGDIILGPAGFDVLPNLNYTVNLGSITSKYLTIHAAELWVQQLVAQDVIATIGGRIIVAPTTTLTQDLAAANTAAILKHNYFNNGDIVIMEAYGQVEFIRIDSAATPVSGGYEYSVVRNLDATGANNWYAGDALVLTTQFIDIYSYSGLNGQGAGPTIVGNVRTTSFWSSWVPHWAIGNLDGLYGYGTAVHGLAAGRYSAGHTWIAADNTNGFRIMHHNTQIARWYAAASGEFAAGDIIVGQAAANQTNLVIKSGAVHIRNNQTQRISMTAAGILTINDSSGNAVFTFNSSAGAEFTLPLTLAATGGIWQGTGTFVSPNTGLKIWNGSGIGRLTTYNNSTVQIDIDTEGRLIAGAGALKIDATGLSFMQDDPGGDPTWDPSTNHTSSIKFNRLAQVIGHIDVTEVSPIQYRRMRIGMKTKYASGTHVTGSLELRLTQEFTGSAGRIFIDSAESDSSTPSSIAIGLAVPNASLLLTGGGLLFSTSLRLWNLTTTNRDALITSPTNGMLFYNTTVSKPQAYAASAWRNIVLDNIQVTGTGALGGGGALSQDRTITLNTPATLTVSTTNSAATNHTHAITSSSNPGAAASLLSTNASGAIQITALGINTTAPAAGRLALSGSISASAAIGTRVNRTTALTLVNGTWTTITWQSANFDNNLGTAHWLSGTNPTRVTCRTAGVYLIIGQAHIEANNTNFRGIEIMRNNATIASSSTDGNTTSSTRLTTSTTWNLAVNDYIELRVYQISGTNLNLQAEFNTPALTVIRLA